MRIIVGRTWLLFCPRKIKYKSFAKYENSKFWLCVVLIKYVLYSFFKFFFLI